MVAKQVLIHLITIPKILAHSGWISIQVKVSAAPNYD
ncbi:hypothetical protein F441_01425 [Phytophthora nicotianae CJ01A1]|uniref:Uncharacterized protein n=2 Tax=Phytophthora nicotianae TaxID=4792 RepID=W2JU15_PHYNI|nr:hypothetical protein L915_01375 [Phytophthora nicotianae]ETL49118.1 hypothetical protein L916_01345 [Phytophthora nicotianae]ETP25724.1 hypothetical protein F441_01425 [Phytophthora nicotianae CJ01A1]